MLTTTPPANNVLTRNPAVAVAADVAALARYERDRMSAIREVEHMPRRLQATEDRWVEIERMGRMICMLRARLGVQV